MIIPDSFYKVNKRVELTAWEIKELIELLKRQPHDIYEFLNYEKIVNKLKKSKIIKKRRFENE